MPKQKILLIRFSSIGDIVLTTPVLRCLKMQLDVEVHYLTKVSYATVLEANPYIDRLLTIRKRVSELLPLLRSERYDLILDLHHNLRTQQIKWALGSKARSFNKINWQKWMMVQFKRNYLPDRHVVDRYFETVQSLGVNNDGEGLDYFYPQNTAIHPSTLSVADRYIAIGVGAAHHTKRIPRGKIVELCRRLDQPVVLLGGPMESADGRWIAEQAGPAVVNACGILSLHQTALLIEGAQVVVTPDTGIMHMAAAFQRPIVVLWGNTIPEFGMYPYYKKGVNPFVSFEVRPLPCRPCSKIGYEQCPKGHFRCMNDQPMGLVAEAVAQLYS